MENKGKDELFDDAIKSSMRAIDDASETEKKGSVFETLCRIDCSPYIQKKNDFAYMPWASAWGIAKRAFPSTTYRVARSEQGFPYLTDGKTCWVETYVTIDDFELMDIYPITNFANKPIPSGQVTMRDVNDSIKRSLTKCLAMHGLALYLYANEGLPEEVLTGLIEQVLKASTVEELTALYQNATANNDMLRKNTRLLEACKERKVELLKAQNNGVE